MKFLLQITFEECYQELLIDTQEYVNKYGDYMSPYKSCIQSLACKYEDDILYTKAPQTRAEQLVNNTIILTLETILQTPLFFDPNEENKIEKTGQYISAELYQKYITTESQVDPEFHFIFYMSLTDSRVVADISRFLSQLPSNLPFVVDIVAIPNELSCLYRKESFDQEDIQIMANNLSSLISLKDTVTKDTEKCILFDNIYFLQNIDEANHALQFSHAKLAKLFGNLLLAFVEGYDYISDRRLYDPITTFGIELFELDKYAIVNNWAVNIFQKLCYDVIGDIEDQKKVDKEKVDKLFKEILEEERNGLDKINLLSDNQVKDSLNEWKENFKKIILDKIIDAQLTNAEKDLLLSYFQKISNRDLLRLEEFDFDKLSLFDSLYIPYIDQTTDKENPYSRLKDVILQIQQIKKDMEKLQRRIEETSEIIDENYHKDGKWTDEGYQIGDDIFRIHKDNDLIGNIDPSDELLTEYEPDVTKTLPLSADLKTYFPPIKNQGTQGACASFSLTSVFEYFLSSGTHKYDDMSEAFVYYNARARNGKTNTDNGANLHDVIYGMADKGVCLEELCKYNPATFDEKPSDEAYVDGETRKVTNAKTVPINVDVIKAAINEGYPVVGCFKIFKSLQDNTSGYIPFPSDTERKEDDGFHAMVICGYNDKHGHFIVRNSWGEGFGDNGYCYLPYSYVRDNDLTRYAVAITGINAKEFIKHEPVEDDFDFEEQDSNIRYAILINMLKEDEHKLEADRQKVKELINELRKLINDIKSKSDIINSKITIDNQIRLLDSNNHELESKLDKVSLWDNKFLHIVHGCVLIVSIITIGIGIYYKKQPVWISGSVASVLDIISWVITSFMNKRSKRKQIEHKIESNNNKKVQLFTNQDEREQFRDRVIQILDAIGEIDVDSKFNRDLLNLIIVTLNDCYNQISSFLKNNYPKEKNNIVFPDWFGNISKEIGINDFFRRMITAPNGKNVGETLREIQTEILKKLDALFDKDINALYDGGNSSSWKSFLGDVAGSTVYAQIDSVIFNNDIERAKRKQCAYFLSNLENTPDLNVSKTDISSNSKNRFIFIKVKKVNIDELVIFKGVN